MFDIVKDYFNTYNDELKKVKLSELVAIYIKPNNENFFLFERFNEEWMYENKNGKFDYKIDKDATIEDLIENLKKDCNFDEDFIIRVYSYINEKIPDFVKVIMPARRKLFNQEYFAEFELERLRKLNTELYKNDEEQLKEFNKHMEVVASDVNQIVRLISAQSHNEDTLKLTMSLVSQILAGVPITAIDDNEICEKDWITFKTANENDSNIKKYINLEDTENIVEEVYLNIRCPRIIKVIYKNNITSETYNEYYDSTNIIFVDPETKNNYWGENSIASINIPWNFEPIKEVMISDDDMKKDLIPIEEVRK